MINQKFIFPDSQDFRTISDRCQHTYSAYIHGITPWGAQQEVRLRHGPEELSQALAQLKTGTLTEVTEFLTWELMATAAENFLALYQDEMRQAARDIHTQYRENPEFTIDSGTFVFNATIQLDRPVAAGFQVVERTSTPLGCLLQTHHDISRCIFEFVYDPRHAMWFLKTAYGVIKPQDPREEERFRGHNWYCIGTDGLISIID